MTGKISEADKRAIKKYHREKCSPFTVRLNKVQDADIISFLESQPCKIDTFRQAIRMMMADLKTEK